MEGKINRQKLQKFNAGDVILHEGETNLNMYRIVSGKAEVYVDYGTDSEVLMGIIKEGAYFGEFGLLLRKPAINTVIAYTDMLVLKITEGNMGNFIQENHTYVLSIMRNMARTMMTMKYHIDLLSEELEKSGSKDEEEIHDARRVMRDYTVYSPEKSIQAARMRFFGSESSV
ncbi:MAG: cyclic nucleotide-binding domain-containing protein [Lachnospiraceae bacterium]|nr:cyclic nucleotide-binding domain-containing protein [Lachnospiraceae bacterium]